MKIIERKISALLGEIKKVMPKGSNIKKKAAVKKVEERKKKVMFNHDVEMHDIDGLLGKRTWNDHKKRKDGLIRGKFSDEEVKKLMIAICSYVKENNLREEGLITLCSKSKEELSEDMKGAWCIIAECL